MRCHSFIRFVAVITATLGCSSNQSDADSEKNANTMATPSGSTAANAGANAPSPMAGAVSSANTASSAGKPAAGAPGSASSTGGVGATTAASGGSEAPTASPNVQAGSGGAMAVAGAAGTAGAAGAAPTESGGAFEQCVAALMPMCGYDQKMVACSSLMTATIPLSSGGTYGGLEIKGGPYGAYVEWNQGMEFANPVNASESSCELIASTFGEPPEVTEDVLDLRGGDLALYTIYRPACMRDGETYPVITWGNGTCGQSGGYAGLNATLASHGFVVISANSRFTDAGNREMLRALDLAKALNEQEGSIFYKRLNLEKIGAMGHSQGASATANASSDPRIKSVILWNGGLSVTTKPFLAVSGDRDIGGYTPAQMDMAVQSSSLPAAFLYYKKVLETGGSVTGHLTLMEQADRVWEPTVAWWKYQLNGDEEAKKMFVGSDCGLCSKPDEFAFGANANLK